MFQWSRFALLVLSLVLATKSAHAIPEADFENIFASQVKPFYETVGVSGTFPGVKGVPIYFRYFQAPDEKGAVVLVNGASEFTLKHAETIYDLYQSGYSVYSLDHRHQGYSGKLIANPKILYVDHFDDYIDDLDYFIRKIVQPETHKKLFLIGHSMGGAISALYLERFPTVFTAAALSAPMIQINTDPYPEFVAYWLVASACALGKGQDYAPGQGPKDPAPAVGVRDQHYHQVLAENPVLAMSGVSNLWVKEGMDADREIMNHAADARTPLLLLQAGKDASVRPGGQNDFCAKASACKVMVLSESAHDILVQGDAVRDVALQAILQHFESVDRKVRA